jgi:hypothetical protein
MGNGRNSPVIGDNGFMTVKGDNAQTVRNMLYIYNMPAIDLNSDQAITDRIQEYFKYCIEHDIKPGVEGMAMALGVNRRTLWNWETETSGTLGNNRRDIIKKSKQFLALYLENLAQNGKINPVTAIFLFKNHFNYVDKQEFEIAPRSGISPTLSPAEIAKQIPQDIPVDVDFEDE